MIRRGRLEVDGRDLVLAVLVASCILVPALVSVQRSHGLTVERRLAADRGQLTDVAAGVASDLERSLWRVHELAAVTAAPAGSTLPARQIPGVDQVALVGVADGRPLQHPLVPGRVLDDRGVAAALARARDSGDPQLGPPIEHGGQRWSPVISARYASDGEAGTDTATRREQLVGWVVAPLRLDELVSSEVGSGIAAAIGEPGDLFRATDQEPPAAAPSTTLEVGGRATILQVGDPEPVGYLTTAALLAVALAVSAAAGVAVVVGGTRLRHQQREAERGAEQVRLIGEIAPIVQQSLELAEVLPAVAVQLSEHFGLAGITMSTGLTGAAKVDVFSLGAQPAPGARSFLAPPPELLAGETLSLALQRGGRSVAHLQMVAGRTLDETELQSLRAVTELVTSAIANASLYASQQTALVRLRDLDALKTVFLSTASHELRTPVTAISGFTTLLAANWGRFDDDQRREFVVRIGANARALSAVVQDLLDFALLEKGTLTVTPVPLDLGAIVAGVVDRLTASFQQHTMVLHLDPAPAVAVDERAIDRVLTNLLTNAVKFSPIGTTVTTSVEPDLDTGGARLRVCDEGPGVPVADRERIFTRFYRGSGDTVVQTRGVGIGLSVVAELVERMAGTVDVGDAPGGGACFTVRLPPGEPITTEEVSHAPTT